MSTPPHVLQVKDKVQRYLSDQVGSVEIDRDGDFTFQFGSARIFISCYAMNDERTLIDITFILLSGVQPTPELYEYVAVEGDYRFGNLTVVRNDESELVQILFTHSLLGDYLDPDELMVAVGVMVNTADDLDDELKKRFGGNVFHEQPEKTD